jgi:hypothetical protein
LCAVDIWTTISVPTSLQGRLSNWKKKPKKKLSKHRKLFNIIIKHEPMDQLWNLLTWFIAQSRSKIKQCGSCFRGFHLGFTRIRWALCLRLASFLKLQIINNSGTI